MTLRHFVESDLDVLVEYRNIEQVWQYQDWDVPYSHESARRFLDDDLSLFVRGEWVQIAIEYDSQLVGDLGVKIPQPGETSWLGYSLHPNYWGRGIATGAVNIATRRMADFGATTVRASVDTRNDASARLLVRCGFTITGDKAPITVRGVDYLDDVYELAVGFGAVGTDGS